MNTKLTLKIDEPVIESAKQFARAHHTSLSKVGELAGVLKDKKVSVSKSDYINYLEEKYK